MKYPSSSSKLSLCTVALLVAFSGCSDSPLNSGVSSNRSAAGKIVEVTNGGKVSKASPHAAKISTGSAEVIISPNALQVDTDVSVADFKASNSTYIVDELGMGKAKVQSVRVAQVKATTEQSLAQPMTIKLKLETSLMAAFLSDPNYFVVHSFKDISGAPVANLISGDKLKIADGFASFTVKHFGVAELFKSDTPPPAAKTLPAGQMNAFGKDIEVAKVSSRLFESAKQIEVTGKHFDKSTRIKVMGAPVTVRFVSAEVITFKVPQVDRFGADRFTVLNRYKSLPQKMFYKGDKTDRPLIARAPAAVCKGISYYDGKGAAQTGAKICVREDIPRCSAVLNRDCLLGPNDIQGDPRTILGEHIAQGHSIAGVPGTLTYGQLYTFCKNDGDQNCRATADYPAALATDIPANVLKGNTVIAGIDGQFSYPVKVSCTAQKTGDCKIAKGDTQRLAVNADLLTRGVIRSGVTIAGVQGDYPSTNHPLAGENIPDLTETTLAARLKSTGRTQFFDREGNRHVVRGSSGIEAENIVKDIQLLGVPGTLVKDIPVEGDAWDYAFGYSHKGITGKIKGNCRNLVLPNSDPLPQNNVAGHDDARVTLNPWGDESVACKDEGWTVTPANCSNTETNCQYTDLKTKKVWTFAGNDVRDYAGAVQYCQGLNLGNKNDWRVPTQKEALQAMINGVASLATDPVRPQNGRRDYWTSTHPVKPYGQRAQSDYWSIHMGSGLQILAPPSVSINVMCVR